jgi:hypothetical protein
VEDEREQHRPSKTAGLNTVTPTPASRRKPIRQSSRRLEFNSPVEPDHSFVT